MITSRHCLLVLSLTVFSACASAAPRNTCGDLANAFGPWDHRLGNVDNRVNIVLNAHFPPEVETLEHGSRGTLGADLDYTLRALPNFTRALISMARLSAKLRTVQPPGAKYHVECYFDRAIRFRPDDYSVRAAYGNYLFEHNRPEEALHQFEAALAIAPKNATVNYNAGLAYFKTKNFEKANLLAHRAYALGFPLPGLRNLLTQAGKWVEIPPEQVNPAPEDVAEPSAEGTDKASGTATPNASAPAPEGSPSQAQSPPPTTPATHP